MLDEIQNTRAASASPWVDASEELPGIYDGDVLAWFRPGIATVIRATACIDYARYPLADAKRVTHWMPIPEPGE